MFCCQLLLLWLQLRVGNHPVHMLYRIQLYYLFNPDKALMWLSAAYISTSVFLNPATSRLLRLTSYRVFYE